MLLENMYKHVGMVCKSRTKLHRKYNCQKKFPSEEMGCLTFYVSLSPKRQWHQTLGWFLCQLLTTRIKNVSTPLVWGKRKSFQKSLKNTFKRVEISRWWSFLPLSHKCYAKLKWANWKHETIYEHNPEEKVKPRVPEILNEFGNCD